MTIGSSNISLVGTIRDEYDVDTGSTSISSLYKNGPTVPSFIGTTAINSSVPESGPISFSDFVGGSVAGLITSSSTLLTSAPMYWAANGTAGNNWPWNYGIWPGNAYNTYRVEFRGTVGGTNPSQNMVAGRDYAFIGNTGAAQTGGRTMWYGTGVSSRGGNSGQGVSTLGAVTLAQAANNTPNGSQIFLPQGCRNNVSYASGNSNPSSYILFCNGQYGTEDAGKGGVAIFIWPKKQLQKIYSNFGFTFNTGN